MTNLTHQSPKHKSLTYLAGIIDGEGHFCRVPLKNGRGKNYLTNRLIVNQKDARLTTWLKTNYGGSTYFNPKYNINRWELKGQKVSQLAKQLQPYLIVKQEQVLSVLETLPVLVPHISRQQGD